MTAHSSICSIEDIYHSVTANGTDVVRRIKAELLLLFLLFPKSLQHPVSAQPELPVHFGILVHRSLALCYQISGLTF